MEISQIQKGLASVRSHLQFALARQDTAHKVIQQVNQPLSVHLKEVQAHRDSFPALGEIADTFLSYVQMADALIHQMESMLEGNADAGLRSSLSGAPPAGPDVQGGGEQRLGQEGDLGLGQPTDLPPVSGDSGTDRSGD